MLESYANQLLTWKHVTGINEYNEPSYSTTPIRGRKEVGLKLVTNSQGHQAGQEIVSSACVFTSSPVEAGDQLDGQSVITVDTNIGLSGAVAFYEVYLK